MTEKEERYRQVCDQEIQQMLRGTFMQTDPSEEDDANLIIEADIRSRRWTFEGVSYCSHVNQFCSLLAVDGVDSVLYERLNDNAVYVDELVMHPYNCRSQERVRASLNQFNYPMMLDKGQNMLFDERLATIASSVDDKHDEEYILSREGQMFFYSYYLGGITKFNQSRKCFRLYSMRPEMIPDLLRKEILKAQAIAIQYLFRYPAFCKPAVPDFHLDCQTASAIMKEASQDYTAEILDLSSLIKDRLQNARIQVEHI